jgi:hypothetical protein
MSSLVTIKQSDDTVSAAATALSAFCGNQMLVWNIPFLVKCTKSLPWCESTKYLLSVRVVRFAN